MTERRPKRVQIRMMRPSEPVWIAATDPSTVTIQMEPGEYLAGYVPSDPIHGWSAGFLIAKAIEDAAPTKPEPEPSTTMRLCHALLHLDAGKRVSRMTWGCCFLVIDDGEILVYEPTSIGKKGWWLHRVGTLPLDSDDLLAEDWCVVSDEQFARWDKEVQGL